MSLIIEDLQEGHGKEAVKGKEITVHYTGWLEDLRDPKSITFIFNLLLMDYWLLGL